MKVARLGWSMAAGILVPVMALILFAQLALLCVALHFRTGAVFFGFLALVGCGWPLMLYELATVDHAAACFTATCHPPFNSVFYVLYPIPWTLLVYWLSAGRGSKPAGQP